MWAARRTWRRDGRQGPDDDRAERLAGVDVRPPVPGRSALQPPVGRAHRGLRAARAAGRPAAAAQPGHRGGRQRPDRRQLRQRPRVHRLRAPELGGGCRARISSRASSTRRTTARATTATRSSAPTSRSSCSTGRSTRRRASGASTGFSSAACRRATSCGLASGTTASAAAHPPRAAVDLRAARLVRQAPGAAASRHGPAARGVPQRRGHGRGGRGGPGLGAHRAGMPDPPFVLHAGGEEGLAESPGEAGGPASSAIPWASLATT